jgi:hypothetical protein
MSADPEPFTMDLNGFKQSAKEFIDKVNAGATRPQIEAGLRALRLAYIYLKGDDHDREQAITIITLVQRKADAY